MPKAHKLPISTQRKIAKRKEQEPKLPATELARIYHCTTHQVYAALKRANAGELRDRRGSKTKLIEGKGDVLAQLTQLAHNAIATLMADKTIGVMELVAQLDKVTGLLKTIQSMQLQSAIRGTDAAVIAHIVRRGQPDATDTDVIRIYKESVEACKAGL